MIFIQKIINVVNQFIYNNHINWIKTLYINIWSLPLRDAVKIPIYP